MVYYQESCCIQDSWPSTYSVSFCDVFFLPLLIIVAVQNYSYQISCCLFLLLNNATPLTCVYYALLVTICISLWLTILSVKVYHVMQPYFTYCLCIVGQFFLFQEYFFPKSLEEGVKKVKIQLSKLKHNFLLSETHAYSVQGMNTGILSYDQIVCTAI